MINKLVWRAAIGFRPCRGPSLYFDADFIKAQYFGPCATKLLFNVEYHVTICFHREFILINE